MVEFTGLGSEASICAAIDAPTTQLEAQVLRLRDLALEASDWHAVLEPKQGLNLLYEVILLGDAVARRARDRPALRPYRPGPAHGPSLVEGLREMIAEGRLVEGDIPEDFEWLRWRLKEEGTQE